MSVRKGDPENSDVPDEDRWLEPALEGVAGAAVGAWVGAVVDPTTGGLVGGAVPATLLAFRTHFNQKQLVRAGRVWNGAAAICEVDPQELPALVDSTSKEFLLAAALQAGADSALEAKIVALGKVLADGLRGDDAMVDTTTMLASAFGDIERPHVEVLDYLAIGPSPLDMPVESRFRGVSGAVLLGDFLDANPGYRISISAIVATLERHGVIRPEEEPVENLAWSAQFRHRYRLTLFGNKLLDRLREAGEVEQ